MTKAISGNNTSDQSEPLPHRVRLPGFITEEEIGLGDAIKRATSYFGIQPWVAANIGRPHSTDGWFSRIDSRSREFAFLEIDMIL